MNISELIEKLKTGHQPITAKNCILTKAAELIIPGKAHKKRIGAATRGWRSQDQLETHPHTQHKHKPHTQEIFRGNWPATFALADSG